MTIDKKRLDAAYMNDLAVRCTTAELEVTCLKRMAVEARRQRDIAIACLRQICGEVSWDLVRRAEQIECESDARRAELSRKILMLFELETP